ncbi:MAG: hypothetical protein ABFD76_15440 [Smithella sp.]
MVKMIPIFKGNIDNASIGTFIPFLKLATYKRLGDYLKTLHGKNIELTIRERKSQRSLNQNRYYFGVVLDILSNHTGYESDEMHEILKFKFLKTVKADMEYIKSTTKLNTVEFEEYLTKIKQWAAVELNCYIPDPNECEAA